ncbi:MAG: transposase, partial [Myxococcaceae bacterium]|nr:transposase [Myxococcaceae bacterium]
MSEGRRSVSSGRGGAWATAGRGRWAQCARSAGACTGEGSRRGRCCTGQCSKTWRQGFSLQANTHFHANDREGLERLCRYGARGALALERFEEAKDGRIAYRMKRPMPNGTTHLLFTEMELLRRVASLVP